jgi:hypothetical protein
MSAGNALLAVVAVLYGLFEIGYGIFAYRRNAFKFYFASGFFIGVPFLAVAAILILRPEQPPRLWDGLIFVAWAGGVAWKAWRKRVARKTQPVEWEKWERMLHGG